MSSSTTGTTTTVRKAMSATSVPWNPPVRCLAGCDNLSDR